MAGLRRLRGQANLPAARTRLLGERSAHPNLTMPMPASSCLRPFVVASLGLLVLAALAPVATAQCTAAQWDTDGTFGLNGPVWRTTMWDQDGAGPLTPRLVVDASVALGWRPR